MIPIANIKDIPSLSSNFTFDTDINETIEQILATANPITNQ